MAFIISAYSLEHHKSRQRNSCAPLPPNSRCLEKSSLFAYLAASWHYNADMLSYTHTVIATYRFSHSGVLSETHWCSYLHPLFKWECCGKNIMLVCSQALLRWYLPRRHSHAGVLYNTHTGIATYIHSHDGVLKCTPSKPWKLLGFFVVGFKSLSCK